MADEFTLDDARAALSAIRDLATDGLATPFSQADLNSILAAGIEVKSANDGLLDFPTTIDGTDAYWCWRAGEDEIEWWHPRSTGFAGRRRIVRR